MDNPSPWPNGFPSPPQVSCPNRLFACAKRGHETHEIHSSAEPEPKGLTTDCTDLGEGGKLPQKNAENGKLFFYHGWTRMDTDGGQGESKVEGRGSRAKGDAAWGHAAYSTAKGTMQRPGAPLRDCGLQIRGTAECNSALHWLRLRKTGGY
jgi:hypothetical protein